MLKFGDEIVTESGESPNLMLNLGTYLEDIFGTSPNLVMNQFVYKFITKVGDSTELVPKIGDKYIYYLIG